MWILIRQGTAYLMDGAHSTKSKILDKKADGSMALTGLDLPNLVINDNAPVPAVKPVPAKVSSQDLFIEELAKNTGLTKPIRKPSEFGFKEGDTYVLVDADKEVAKAFDFKGSQIFAIPCRATGQNPQWRNNSGDTPPGLYKIGEVYNDYARVGDAPGYDRTLMSYGWITFDMVDLEGNEDRNARAGICWHGGGSGEGWPGAWKAKQGLHPTLGCLRSYNVDLLEKLRPRVSTGTVYVAVYQDSK